jgi:hypothetical protein
MEMIFGSIVLQKYQDLADFNAFSKDVRREAFSRITTIEIIYGDLQKLQENVKLCPTQCERLLRTCSNPMQEASPNMFGGHQEDERTL